MRYKVTLGSYVLANHFANGKHSHPMDAPYFYPRVPDSDLTRELDTEAGLGKQIWEGYLEMYAEQIANPRTGEEPRWSDIRKTDKDPEMKRFREAINIFMRFMAGEGTLLCRLVYEIAEEEAVSHG